MVKDHRVAHTKEDIMSRIHWSNRVDADFNTAADWSAHTVPGAGDDAILDASGVGHYTVAASTSETVNSIQTARAATLSITGGVFTASAGTGSGANRGTILIGDNTTFAAAGTLRNRGTIELNSGGDLTRLSLSAFTTLRGGGHVTLSDSSNNFISGVKGSSAPFLINVDNTISGAGFLFGSIVNRAKGVIDATGTNNALVIDGSFGLTVTNAGLIESTGAGGLVVEFATIANTGRIAITGLGGLTLNGTIDDTNGGTLDPGRVLSLGNSAVVGGSLTLATGGVTTVTGAADLATALTNHGAITIGSNATLTLHGAVTNTGSINLANFANFADLVVGVGGLTLTGGGAVTLSENAGNLIVGGVGDTLTNVDNTISGAGFIGDEDEIGTFTLVNQAAGVIDAKGPVRLIIGTGANTITNAGIIEATGRGGGFIFSAVDNTGTLKAAGGNLTVDGAVTGAGSATVSGATLAFGSSFTQNVNFTGTTGVLELAQSQSYTGKVRGFSLTGGTSLDLTDIGFVNAGEATFSGDKVSGVLTVTDGTHTAHLTLIGDYIGSAFVASSDGHGGVSIVDTNAGFGASAAPPHALSTAASHQFIAAMAGLGAGGGGALEAGAGWRHIAPVSLIAPRMHAA